MRLGVWMLISIIMLLLAIISCLRDWRKMARFRYQIITKAHKLCILNRFMDQEIHQSKITLKMVKDYLMVVIDKFMTA